MKNKEKLHTLANGKIILKGKKQNSNELQQKNKCKTEFGGKKWFHRNPNNGRKFPSDTTSCKNQKQVDLVLVFAGYLEIQPILSANRD